jgi:hypothetical protein
MHSPSDSQVKDSGMALALLLLLAGMSSSVRSLYVAAALVLVVDMLWPPVFRPFAVAWFGLASALGAVTSRALLTVLFFLLVTPIAAVRRALRHDPMRLRLWRAGRDSVFTVRDHRFTPEDVEHPY